MPDQPVVGLAACFDDAVCAAIAEWTEGTARPVWLPSRRWRRSGYTGSELVAVVVGGVRGPYGRGGEKLVLKVCPPGRFAAETSRHEEAWASNVDFAERHFVRQRFTRYPVRDGRFLMFQEMAGNLSEIRTLSALPDDQRPAALRYATDMILTDWNRALKEPRTTTVADYFRMEIGAALDETRSARRWAEAAGIVNPPVGWILIDEDQECCPLPNPILDPDAAFGIGNREIDYLVGLAHGDLHLDNLLVRAPKGRPPRLAKMQVIDLSGFQAEAPITRDPVTLMLSALLHAVPDLPGDQAEALLSYVVSPEAEAPHRLPRVLADTVWSIYQTAADAAGTWYDEWRAQYLLSLQAQALLYTSYDNARVRGRWWYFRLAARAAL